MPSSQSISGWLQLINLDVVLGQHPGFYRGEGGARRRVDKQRRLD